MAARGAARSAAPSLRLLLSDLSLATSRSPSPGTSVGCSRWANRGNTDVVQPRLSLVSVDAFAVAERTLLRVDGWSCVAAGSQARGSAQPCVA